MEIDRWLTDFATRFLQGEGALGWALEHWLHIVAAALILGIALDWLAWVLRFPRGRRARALLMRALGHDASRYAAPRVPAYGQSAPAPRQSAPAPEPRALPDFRPFHADENDAHLITEAMRADAIGDAVPFVPQSLRRPPAASPPAEPMTRVLTPAAPARAPSAARAGLTPARVSSGVLRKLRARGRGAPTAPPPPPPLPPPATRS